MEPHGSLLTPLAPWPARGPDIRPIVVSQSPGEGLKTPMSLAQPRAPRQDQTEGEGSVPSGVIASITLMLQDAGDFRIPKAPKLSASSSSQLLSWSPTPFLPPMGSRGAAVNKKMGKQGCLGASGQVPGVALY